MSRFIGPRPRWVLHPIVFGSAYVLNLALSNQVAPAGFLRPLIVTAIAAGLLMLIGRLVLGNRWDGALLATALIVVIVSPVPLSGVWFYLRVTLGETFGTIVMGGLLIVLLGWIGVDFLQRRRRHQPARRPSPETLQILSVAVLVAVIGSSLVTHPPGSSSGGEQAAGAKPVETPDIVVIMLDGYPRSDVLEDRIGIDDRAFLDGLRQRGFDVVLDSRSNYMHTSLTLASMFQMRYVEQIPALRPLVGSAQRELGALQEAAEDGRAFSLLDKAGYQVLLSTPGWEHVTFRRAADKLLDSGELSDLEISLLHQTWLLYLINVVTPNLFTESLRDRIVHSFDALDRFALERRADPAFLLLHVPAPHLPLVVQADGSAADLPALLYEKIDRDGFGMTDREYADAWASELAYIGGRVLSSVDLLLASEAGRGAVVVVMADHGYNFEVRQDDPEARIGALFAARTPSAAGLLADGPTPVNMFRAIFDRYFGMDLGMLPKRYFVSDWRSPLQISELHLPSAPGRP